jgi:mevalonate pyrophosphate decarboxylase
MVDRIINRETKQTKVAYTFDAGPHGFLFVHEDMLDTVLTYLHRQFGSREEVLNSKARAVIAGTQGMLSLPFSNYG